MGVQSLIHYGIDLTLVAMLLAAIRHNTGLVFAYDTYDLSNYIHRYLSWGEYCYSKVVSYVKQSERFRKQSSIDLRRRFEELKD
ncbi:hypothetical protein TPHA_0N01810 [Tetrapisispora phaffii CBS 4417]|uniref:DUF1748-domain-containing protein n=1 Tax=Tetrapisispora phaffii (strain ATCC 24235 / CBS 4417 / NBRC 1672 / NRRL Y-8282 / UCD 70-5) TaxID=1071381 RepID=G8C1D4_TETPH|nr:hypothetical protein TPHA_0N01810 [Tetrapisispora phaffii CBS 4417]CCE65962.1 hypothetical protein TPHA_0N01810 [Tetrapisispora phaffii CBS 4417]